MRLPEDEHICEGSYCVPRQAMPQVDEKDLGKLLGHLINRRIEFTGKELDPLTIHSHQRVEATRLKDIPEEMFLKPILVSADMKVIDGNHRRMAHVIRGSKCPCILINLRFEPAVDAIFECPCAYSYGDGREHPVSY